MKSKKFKTRKALARRVKITGSGKILRAQGFNRHLKANKSKSRTRAKAHTLEVTGALRKKWRKVLGIGG